MELSNVEVITSLLANTQSEKRVTGPRMTRRPSDSSYVAPAAKSVRPQCRCGICPKCHDNERWERIFQEKFADPYYYARRVRRDSSLNV